MRKFALFCVTVFLCAGINCDSIAADRPLLQTGKRTVYQRVISHPGAHLYAKSDKTGNVSTPRTFTSFYIYQKSESMLKVGVSTTRADGWIPKTECTEWPQAITLLFTPQDDRRQPVLFFKDLKGLQNTCESESIKDTVAEYVEMASSGVSLPDASPVLAMEPTGEKGQVAKDNFYLLPVLDINTQYSEAGTRFAQVACVNAESLNTDSNSDAGGNASDRSSDNPAKDDAMTTALAFVIDTTISMGPYIDKVKEMIYSIFDEMQTSQYKDNLALAVVAFRSNPKLSPKTEYNTRVIFDFTGIKDRHQLASMLKRLDEAKASTHAYDEDAFAGVKDAIDKLSWDKFSGRAMLLITDAGPLAAGDSASRTGMTAEGLSQELRTNNIFLTAIHIKTKAGRNDFAHAEKNYRALSALGNNRDSYMSINATTPAQGAKAFEESTRVIASTYKKYLEYSNKNIKPQNYDSPPSKGNHIDEARRISEAIGYAMRLQYLGNKKHTKAPVIDRAWVADADLTSLEVNKNAAPVIALEPAVLLTKSQLSQLRKQLQTIIETANEAFLQDSANFNFYEQLISAAAQMSSDPAQFNRDPNANLAQKGVLLEVLDGLPYKSRIVGMRQEDWVNMSTGEQREFVKRLQGLIKDYEAIDADTAHWEGFGSDNPNEWVYRVNLNLLP